MARAPAAANTRADNPSHALARRSTWGPPCSAWNAVARSLITRLRHDGPQQFGDRDVVGPVEAQVVLADRFLGLGGMERDPGAQPLVAGFQLGVRTTMLQG